MNNDFVFKVKPVNAYFRIGKYFVILLLLLFMCIWIAQVFANNLFSDFVYYYGAMAVAGIVTIVSFVKCKAIIYEFCIYEEIVHIKWKILEKHYQKSVTIDDIEAFLIPLGKQESGLRIKIKDKKDVIVLDQCRISHWGDDDFKEIVRVVKERKQSKE